MALFEYKGLFFSENTPSILMDVIIDCIERGVKVHILTGDPISGLVTPSLKSVGVFVKSSSNNPTPMFEVEQLYANDDTINSSEPKCTWIRTDRILKINEVDTCSLLYQSYECQCSPLKFITEVKLSPYGDRTEKSKIVCSNPEIEITVPKTVDPEMLAKFLFGQVHYLADCLHKFE